MPIDNRLVERNYDTCVLVHRRHGETIDALRLEKNVLRSGRDVFKEVQAYRRRRGDVRHRCGDRVAASRIGIETKRRSRAKVKSGYRVVRNRVVLVEPVERRIVAHRERARKIAHRGERRRTAAGHGECTRRVLDGVDRHGDGYVKGSRVYRAAVLADIDIETRAVPVCNPSLRMDIVGLERAAVDVDRKRTAGTFVLNMLRHKRSAVQVQRSVSVGALRPLVVFDRNRSAVLRERRRSASLRANDKIAIQRPVAAGLLCVEGVELHIARTRNSRIRGIEVALVEVAGSRRDVDRCPDGTGVVVQVV